MWQKDRRTGGLWKRRPHPETSASYSPGIRDRQCSADETLQGGRRQSRGTTFTTRRGHGPFLIHLLRHESLVAYLCSPGKDLCDGIPYASSNPAARRVSSAMASPKSGPLLQSQERRGRGRKPKIPEMSTAAPASMSSSDSSTVGWDSPTFPLADSQWLLLARSRGFSRPRGGNGDEHRGFDRTGWGFGWQDDGKISLDTRVGVILGTWPPFPGTRCSLID